ncbi:TIR domain-containing protein [Castellaniella sp.]|uniref:TIR domain-containing protein n=1 Tax=Castellaniella sp. TaxID=1955812 RepID=UPI003C712D73
MAKAKQKSINDTDAEKKKPARSYLSQTEVPAHSLDQALCIAEAIFNNYGGKSTTPLDVAAALDLQPSSSQFRMLAGASIAYGITIGGYNAKEIEVTQLAQRIFRPQEEYDDLSAKREALLKPRVIQEFLNKYANSPLPRESIGVNVLIGLGVPENKAERVQKFILESAHSVGLIRTIKDKQYVQLDKTVSTKVDVDSSGKDVSTEIIPQINLSNDDQKEYVAPSAAPTPAAVVDSRRVFITHGKNTSFIEPIKKLLGFGEMTPVVSAEKHTVSQPVPDKVLDDMRSCHAAIIHVDGERTLMDSEAKEHTVINPNVLIEIGAAMALYGRRFVLLVRNGIQLPSNLQGLFEVRYEGDSLDGNATIRLLEAINDMKKTALPS